MYDTQGAFIAGTNIATSATVTSTGVNNKVSPLDTRETARGLLSRTAVSSTGALTVNQDVIVYANASGGAITLTLPDATAQNAGIYIKKIDNSSNAVTIQRAGSDTIEDPTNPLTNPTATSYVLETADESVLLDANGTAWRVIDKYFNNRIAVEAYQSSTHTVNTSLTKVLFQTESYDYSSNFSSSTFTAPIDGIYDVSGVIHVTGATAGGFIIALYVNTVLTRVLYESGDYTSSTDLSVPFRVQPLLSATDTVEIYAQAKTASRTTVSGISNTFLNITYKM